MQYQIRNLIKKYNYPVPKIKEYSKNGLETNFCKKTKRWELLLDKTQWMTYGETTHSEGLFQVFSHYYIAEGDVITSGLGFGVRESWLLKNPKVTSITCIEKDERVIDLFYNLHPEICDKVKIICGNANEYKGSCDTLLLDHYEGSDVVGFADQSKKILSNINTKKCWFWTYEVYLMHFYLFNNSENRSIFKIYSDMQSYFRLPPLTEKELKIILRMYFYDNKKILTHI